MKQPPVFRDDDWGELPDPRMTNPDATGFAENWQASLGQTIDEGLFISEYLHSAPIRDRNQQLHKYIREGRIPEDKLSGFSKRTRRGTRIDYDGLAQFVKEFDPEIKTDAELKAERDRELGMRREYAESVFDNATADGILGQVAGAIHASAIDPALYPGYFFGPTAAVKATTALRAFGQGAARMGGFVGAEEALIQSQVIDWKQELGVDYTNTEAALAIGGGVLFGGTVGGFASMLGRMARGDDLPDVSKEAHVEWVETEGDAATRSLAQMQNEYQSAPDSAMPVEEFAKRMDEAEAKLNNPTPFYARPPDEIQTEVDDAAADELIETQLREYAEADLPELTVPRQTPEGVAADIPLRQELEVLDAQEQRMLALKDCLSRG